MDNAQLSRRAMLAATGTVTLATFLAGRRTAVASTRAMAATAAVPLIALTAPPAGRFTRVRCVDDDTRLYLTYPTAAGQLIGAKVAAPAFYGVDFSDYMARVSAAVRRNWYAVMPESAMLGDRGRVALQFRIMKDGSVPAGEPVRLIGSGKEPLDRAAVSAIRSSNPFEPLPQAFSGPYIELRFYFLYNLPIEAAYQ